MRNRFVAAAVALPIAVLSRGASAQTPGFSLDRFEPAQTGSDWFTLESLDLRGHLRPAIGLVGDWARKPLVTYAPDGTERTALVSDQLFVHVGASLVAWDRIRFGLNVPLALY